MVVYQPKPVTRYKTRTVVKRGGRRRGRGAGMKAGAMELAWQFASSAGYGYMREGGTDNFNELMNKVPGGDALGRTCATPSSSGRRTATSSTR
jgi:hypothetical protein